MKIAFLTIAFLISVNLFSQEQKSMADTSRSANQVERMDTVKVVSEIDFNRLWIALGDRIRLQNGEEKIFSANDRELIFQLIYQYVVAPAQEDYRRKKSRK